MGKLELKRMNIGRGSNFIDNTLLPLLRDRVFHVTRGARLPDIRSSGVLSTNADGGLGNTYPQSRTSVARHFGYLALFDFRAKRAEDMSWGLHCFWPAVSPIAILFVSPA